MDIDRWRAVSLNLDRALELPEAEREAWLRELEQSEPVLGVEVRGLLETRARRDFDSFLAHGPGAATLDSTSTNLGGRRVGAYLLEREIGRGGMGAVWLASRVDGHYDARVAVKLLTTGWLGEEGARRFNREGTILARLDHPNVARLLDAGVTDNSQPYLVLEYVQGARIDEYCDAHQLSIETRLKLFLDVLSAVSHAHRQLIVHRDIKPANIFITRDGVVKLLDFGIARLLSQDGEAPPVTRLDAALTPQFAAPEQLSGLPITTATDIYALGLVLYLLLTGRHPFPSIAHSPAGIRDVLDTDPPRPSQLVTTRKDIAPDELAATASRRNSTPEALSRAIRGDLDNIIAKALRKSPVERYASVDVFADDLRRYLNHEPVSAVPLTMGYRVGKFVRRYRTGVVLGGIAAAVLVVSTVVTFAQMLEARHQRDEARFQARRAESANEFLNVLLLSDGGPDRATLNGLQRLELGARMAEQQYSGDPRFAGRMLIQLGRQFRGLMNTKRAVELMTEGYEFGRRANDPELMALAQCTSAYAESVSQITDRAAARIAEAKALMSQMRSPDIGLRVDCLQAEALFEGRTGDTDKAEKLLNEAKQLLEREGETHRAAYTAVLTNLGGIYNQTFRFKAGLAMAELVGATHERFGRGGTSARLIALQNQTLMIAQMGELQTALASHRALQKLVREVEPEGAEPFSYPVNRAYVLNRLALPEEALSTLQGVAERARDTQNKMWLIAALRHKATAYAQLGRAQEAQAAVDEAMPLLDSNTVSNPTMRVPLELVRARLDLQRGMLAEARRKVEVALGIAGFPVKKQGPPARMALQMASEVALQSGRPAEAEAYGRDAVQVAEALARGPDTSGDVGEALLTLAKAEIALGKTADARPLLDRAVKALTNGLGAEHPFTREALQLQSLGAEL